MHIETPVWLVTKSCFSSIQTVSFISLGKPKEPSKEIHLITLTIHNWRVYTNIEQRYYGIDKGTNVAQNGNELTRHIVKEQF